MSDFSDLLGSLLSSDDGSSTSLLSSGAAKTAASSATSSDEGEPYWLKGVTDILGGSSNNGLSSTENAINDFSQSFGGSQVFTAGTDAQGNATSSSGILGTLTDAMRGSSSNPGNTATTAASKAPSSSGTASAGASQTSATNELLNQNQAVKDASAENNIATQNVDNDMSKYAPNWAQESKKTRHQIGKIFATVLAFL